MKDRGHGSKTLPEVAVEGHDEEHGDQGPAQQNHLRASPRHPVGPFRKTSMKVDMNIVFNVVFFILFLGFCIFGSRIDHFKNLYPSPSIF